MAQASTFSCFTNWVTYADDTEVGVDEIDRMEMVLLD